MGGPPKVLEGSGWSPAVREGSKGVRRAPLNFGRGLEGPPEVWKGSGGPPEVREDSVGHPKSLGGVGRAPGNMGGVSRGQEDVPTYPGPT